MTNIVNDLPFGTDVDDAYVAYIVIPAEVDDYAPGIRYELIVEVDGKFVTSNGDVVDTLSQAAAELVGEFSPPDRTAEVVVFAKGALVAAGEAGIL
jgi:hypothetical protein